MDTNIAIVIVVVVFSLVAVAVFLRYRQRGEADFKGPFGIHLRVKGTGTPSPGPGISAKGVTSREGGVLAEDTTGRGVVAEKIVAKDDVILSSSGSSQPATTRPSAERQLGTTLSAQGLSAGGDITIQQFVGGGAPLAQLLAFFFRQIGLDATRASAFAKSQFEAYCTTWRSLQALRLAADDLWEKANNDNLLNFAEQLRRTSTVVREGEIFFEDKDHKGLLEVLRAFGDFEIGKERLIEIRSIHQLEGAQKFLGAEYFQDQIAQQIEHNHEHKTHYEDLLDDIRVSFRKRLSNL